MSAELKNGAFYWVRLQNLGNDVVARKPDCGWQPARFTGRTLEGNHPDTWDFLGLASVDGHHFADVIEVGKRIYRWVEPESDDEFRSRAMEDIHRMSQLDRKDILVVTGATLNALCQRYGFIRGVAGPED